MKRITKTPRFLTKPFTVITWLVVPCTVWGQGVVRGKTFQGLVELIIGYIETLIVIIFGLAFALFFYGLAQFMFKAGDTKAQENGRRLMFWGVIAIFVMISFYGIINLLLISFDIFPTNT